MHPHAELIARFYRAFAARDAKEMTACYSEDIVFEDEAMPEPERMPMPEPAL